jgi:hypothetical protein
MAAALKVATGRGAPQNAMLRTLGNAEEGRRPGKTEQSK